MKMKLMMNKRKRMKVRYQGEKFTFERSELITIKRRHIDKRSLGDI